MHCAVHDQAAAIGVCVACGRGLCAACADDTGRVIFCRERCRIEARRIGDLRDYAAMQPALQQAVLARNRRTQLLASCVSLLFGPLLLYWGYTIPSMSMFIAAGWLVLAVGVLQVLNVLRQRPVATFRLCQGCGYNISGRMDRRCPECGVMNV